MWSISLEPLECFLTSGLPLYLISLLPDALASSFSVTVVKMSLLPLAEHFSLFITKSYALISLLPLQLYFPSFAFPFRFMSLEPEEWVSILSQIRSDTFRVAGPAQVDLAQVSYAYRFFQINIACSGSTDFQVFSGEGTAQKEIDAP